MSEVNLDEIYRKYFAFGFLKYPISDHFQERINSLNQYAAIYKIEDYGFFFHTTPFYLDLCEKDEMVWIKIGQIHDGTKLLTMEEIIQRKFVGPDGIDIETIQGNGVVLGFSKSKPQCFIYRNILAASAINYWAQGENILVTDNLRLMTGLLDQPQLNEDVLAEHYIYRAIYGNETYVRDVSNLLCGELLSWDFGKLFVNLEQDLNSLSEYSDYESINPKSVNWFFNQMCKLVGIYMENQDNSNASLLSGGFDSTFIQAAINQQSTVKKPFQTYGYVIDSPQFAFEVEYATDAARALGTNHSTYKISANEYCRYLERSIAILGRPVPDDVRPCFQFLFDQINLESKTINFLYHGQLGDGLHGLPESIRVIQGDKYRNWPVPILKLAASVMSPFSQSKAYGAESAVATLNSIKDINTPGHLLNSAGMYTDLPLVTRCFPESTLHKVFIGNQDLEKNYSDSEWMIEKIHAFDVITDSMHTISLNYQMGLYSDMELVFPFADDLIIKSSYKFDPLIRYYHNHRIKPILRNGLKANVPTLDMDKPKGWSGMGPEFLFKLMREGELRDKVQSIERPGFINQADFQGKLEQPDWFTWNMLTVDIFKKQVLI